MTLKELKNELFKHITLPEITPEEAIGVMAKDLNELIEKFNQLADFVKDSDEQFIKLAEIVNSIVQNANSLNLCSIDLLKRCDDYENRIKKLEESSKNSN